MRWETTTLVGHERAMCELLIAAVPVPGQQPRLSAKAREALERARRCAPELGEEPRLFRIAARMLREECVRLGAREAEYSSARWRVLGL